MKACAQRREEWAFGSGSGQSLARLGDGSFGSIFGYKDDGPIACSWW